MNRPRVLAICFALASVATSIAACSSGGSSSPPPATSNDSGASTTPADAAQGTPDAGGLPFDANFPFDVAVSCTSPAQCADAGEVCCGSASTGSISSACQTSCSAGQSQLCTSPADCPANETCPLIPVVNIGVCTASDAGSNPTPDASDDGG